jgi:hypothetical protein
MMRFWWVNQNQTYEHEVPGGYLWSPKRKANGAINPFYESMREVAPGDLIFSFAGRRIPALGVAATYAYESPKPVEFGKTGYYWDRIGWRVDVRFTRLPKPIRPSDWIEELRPLLPAKYSPLLTDGRGVQAIYLTELAEPLAHRLAFLIGPEAEALSRTDTIRDAPAVGTQGGDGIVVWEEHLRDEVQLDTKLTETEREAVVQARRGQGLFRQRVALIESRCRVTGVTRPEHLRASHCKPWRDSTNVERLDGENGLLLTPSIDHLFDRGFISFRGDGRLLVSPVAHPESLAKMGVPVHRALDVGSFSSRQRKFLDYHRDLVFLMRSVHGQGHPRA